MKDVTKLVLSMLGIFLVLVIAIALIQPPRMPDSEVARLSRECEEASMCAKVKFTNAGKYQFPYAVECWRRVRMDDGGTACLDPRVY